MALRTLTPTSENNDAKNRIYLPKFGMAMSGRQFISTGSNRFGYQNQEEDQEFCDGAVSYKYRIEDLRIGRFFSVDPLAGLTQIAILKFTSTAITFTII